jgi:hypothetical protein
MNKSTKVSNKRFLTIFITNTIYYTTDIKNIDECRDKIINWQNDNHSLKKVKLIFYLIQIVCKINNLFSISFYTNQDVCRENKYRLQLRLNTNYNFLELKYCIMTYLFVSL